MKDKRSDAEAMGITRGLASAARVVLAHAIRSDPGLCVVDDPALAQLDTALTRWDAVAAALPISHSASDAEVFDELTVAIHPNERYTCVTDHPAGRMVTHYVAAPVPPDARPAPDAEAMGRVFHDARLAQLRRDGRIAWEGMGVKWDDLTPEESENERLYRDGIVEAMTAVAAAIAPPVDARAVAAELRAILTSLDVALRKSYDHYRNGFVDYGPVEQASVRLDALAARLAGETDGELPGQRG